MPRGDIVYVRLPEPSSHSSREQVGSRPALVVADNPGCPLLMVAPFTSRRAAQRFPHVIAVSPSPENGLSMPSLLLIFQLRAIDRDSVQGTIGRLEQHVIDDVDDEIRRMLQV